MFFSPSRFPWLVLICLTGLTGGVRAMGDTPVTRSAATAAARDREDTLAWSLLGTVCLTFGMVAACGWGIRRHQRRLKPERELLESLRRMKEHERPRHAGEEPAIQPWEKPADWWRGDFSGD
ncbi:MAG: hypothetical protein EOP86_26180 [Verrucomicrobiaceae bacterium]|nr:MAG: hypothetical protein EOP86_26180 [Verrucomicrobiaceae bacterium]